MESKLFRGFPNNSGWNPVSNNFRRVRKSNSQVFDHDVLNQNPKKSENWGKRKYYPKHRKSGSFQMPRNRFDKKGVKGVRMSPRKGVKTLRENVGLKDDRNLESLRKPKREKKVTAAFNIPRTEKMQLTKKPILKVKKF